MARYVGKVRFKDGQEKFVMSDGTSGYVYPALFDLAAEVACASLSTVLARSDELSALKLVADESVEVWTDIELHRVEPSFWSTASSDRRFLTGCRSQEEWAASWRRAEEASSATPYDRLGT